MSPGDFSFGDYSSTFTSPTIPAFPETLGSLQPIQPSPQNAYPASVHQQHQQHPHPHSHSQQHQPHQHQSNGYVPSPTLPLPLPGGSAGAEKRKAEEISGGHSLPNGRVLSFEDSSRHAAEEDKRKRNTAASARFRIKKKQREQALEKSAKDMTDKVTMLESRISALETENKWLKSLVTEKHGNKDDVLEKLLKEVTAADAGKGDVRDSIHAAGEKAKRKD